MYVCNVAHCSLALVAQVSSYGRKSSRHRIGCENLLEVAPTSLGVLPLECSQAFDHDGIMLGSKPYDSPPAPKLDSQHVLGWVDFREFLQCSSNSLHRQGIGASCIPTMQSSICRVSRWEECFPS